MPYKHQLYHLLKTQKRHHIFYPADPSFLIEEAHLDISSLKQEVYQYLKAIDRLVLYFLYY